MKKGLRKQLLQGCFFMMTLLFLPSDVHAQKKGKKFKDGYIIRFDDTIRCKIFTGFQENEIGHELNFKYADGRTITYHPGSVVKGFGFITDSTEKHYYEIEVPEYWINGQKNNKAYAEILSGGQLRLFKYTEIKNSLVVLPSIIQPGFVVGSVQRNKISYFIKAGDRDTLARIGHNNLIGSTYFTREEIVPFLLGNTPLMAEIGDKFLYIKDLKSFIDRYNTWYIKKK